MPGHVEAFRTMLWAVEITRAMLELNRSLLDLNRDMLRRQQDAAVAMMLQALDGSLDSNRVPSAIGTVDFARLSNEALDRFAMAMRVPSDAARWTTAQHAEAERKAAQR